MNVDLPDDLPVVERDVVRLVVVDARSRVLLLHAHDSTDPALGTCWVLPGGGIENGETHVDAAVRELWEETGIRVDRERVGDPSWRRDATYRFRGSRRLQHEQVIQVRLHDCPAIDASTRSEAERQDCLAIRWWEVAEIVASRERFYPGRLPALLPTFLAGGVIEEPFEMWS